jgi:hypothetical protein
MWQRDRLHLLANIRTVIRLDSSRLVDTYLPALVLMEQGGPGSPVTSTEWLVSRGWTYVEPPVRLQMVRTLQRDYPDRGNRNRLLLTPCWPIDHATLVRRARPASTVGDWWQHVQALGQRCVAFVAQDINLRRGDADAAALLSSAASCGRVIRATVRVGPAHAASAWQFGSAP